MFERKKLLDTSNPKAFKIYSCNVRGGSINCNANLQRKKDGKRREKQKESLASSRFPIYSERAFLWA
jgi:hypothetical protein